MKKIIPLILAVTLFFSGCTLDNDTSDKSGLLSYQFPSEPNIEETIKISEHEKSSDSVPQSAVSEQRSSSDYVPQSTVSEQHSASSSVVRSPTSNKSSSDSVTVPTQSETQGNLVWVPTNGGTKYHRKSSCSKMINPIQVSIETAKANGYTACKRCY